MQLKIFKTMWGDKDGYPGAVSRAAELGYDGIEGPLPRDPGVRKQLAHELRDHGLGYILEIATTHSYVPDRSLPLQAHIDHLGQDLDLCRDLDPLMVTCLGGCDAWPLEQSVRFFQAGMELAEQYRLDISFETHRGRSLFNPWVTLEIVTRIPEIKLTGDFSHWCVVCEGLQGTEEDLIRRLLQNIQHIHGRVGYAQGPQVPDPFTSLYAEDLQSHTRWWQWIWEDQFNRNMQQTTLTPEFGLDGYEYRTPDAGLPLVDVEALNQRMALYLKQTFDNNISRIH